jgi:hypothetical protein
MSKPKLRLVPNPFAERPKPAQPDSDAKALAQGVGGVCACWEAAETAFANLFNAIIRPQRESPALRRAYGAIISAKTRREMIETSAEEFFNTFPNAELHQKLTDLMIVYGAACSRRNDVAHGIIIGTEAKGYHLEANFYTSKRESKTKSPYAYNSQQLFAFTRDFSAVSDTATKVGQGIIDHFRSSPKIQQLRY